MTDLTPHESLPMKKTVDRQFFRLVCSKIGGWFSEHSTANPKCAPDAPIIKGSKFEGTLTLT